MSKISRNRNCLVGTSVVCVHTETQSLLFFSLLNRPASTYLSPKLNDVYRQEVINRVTFKVHWYTNLITFAILKLIVPNCSAYTYTYCIVLYICMHAIGHVYNTLLKLAAWLFNHKLLLYQVVIISSKHSSETMVTIVLLIWYKPNTELLQTKTNVLNIYKAN